jgi:hypothetical protein
MKPARFRALTARSPETLGSLGISVGDFDCCPERRAVRRTPVGEAPGLEVKLDGLAQAGAGRFDVFALRGDGEFGAASDVPIVLFGDQCGEAIVHGRNASEMARRRQV